jgi:EAL domain-containing protein (putative c-di-GMP-specific phosphodiesterase class I)
LTESSIMTEPARTMSVLARLHDMGIQIAVDDFGTGYSSLSYLKRLPVDEMKIDRSFVTEMLTDPDNKAIVQSIVDLARNLSLTVVAEGVEDSETWQMLAEMGCGQAQGYLLSRPLPVWEFEQWLDCRFQNHPTGAHRRRLADPDDEGRRASEGEFTQNELMPRATALSTRPYPPT